MRESREVMRWVLSRMCLRRCNDEEWYYACDGGEVDVASVDVRSAAVVSLVKLGVRTADLRVESSGWRR